MIAVLLTAEVTRAQSKSMREHSAEETEALDAFKAQRTVLSAIARKNARDSAFMKWRDITGEVFDRYLPRTRYSGRFMNISFTVRGYTGDPQEAYNAGIEASRACLDGAIEHIERFGLESRATRPAVPEAAQGFNFYGPIQNLAVATDSAIQSVNQSASTEAAALKAIGGILRESGELRQKEVAQALETIAHLATEMHKPTSGWNWKGIADWTNTLLGIAKNATDVAAKLNPYLPVIAGLFDAAQKMLSR